MLITHFEKYSGLFHVVKCVARESVRTSDHEKTIERFLGHVVVTRGNREAFTPSWYFLFFFVFFFSRRRFAQVARDSLN